MEELEKIVKFVGGSGYGYGKGNGYGYGYGDGYGSGYGSGDGYGSCSGNGSGNGSGRGYVYGEGNGSDRGSGYGLGSGNGSDRGEGYGYGSGRGEGYGDGYGSGSGNGNAIRIKKLNNDLVFYVDGIPTIIDKIRGNIAKCRMVNENDFTTKECYMAKNGNYFAHEETIKKAVESVQSKIYADLDVEDRIKEFCNKFKSDMEYNSAEFFKWHNILTGSCLAGRNQFIESHNIDMTKKYSVKEFIAICENSYGGEVIKRLKEFYR